MKFDEFGVGQKFYTDPYKVTLEEIKAFAKQYDPHYYHIDEVKAEKSIFGSIVASGMHTMSIINGQWVRLGLLGEDMLGGLGIDAKWTNPVCPDDIIKCEIEVINKKLLDETSGMITLKFTGTNQDDEVWAKVKIRIIVAK